MQETRHNCFGTKKPNKTLRQVKTHQHKYQSITKTLFLYLRTHVSLFSPNEEWCYFFSVRNKCCELFASRGVILQSDHQSHLSEFR